MPVIEPGRRSPSWEKVRSRSRFSCSSWDRVGGIGTSITERTIYVQKPATKKNGLTFAISMSHTPMTADVVRHFASSGRMADHDQILQVEPLDELGEIVERLDLKNLVMVGHSTGGGEVAHYIGRHGGVRHRNGECEAILFCGWFLNVYGTFSNGGPYATNPVPTGAGKARSAAYLLPTGRSASGLDYRHRASLRKTDLSLRPTR